MNRAYSVLEIKAVSEDVREITGIATTPSTDRVGDVLESMGAEYAAEIPALWQHNHHEPVGHVHLGKATPKGIPFTIKMASTDEPGALKDRLDEAWQSVKLRLVKAVSIGFRALEYARMEGGGIRFLKFEILELSLVTVPANADCTITSIKSIDTDLRAASGQSQTDEIDLSGASEVPTPPGASGSSKTALPVVSHLKAPKEGKMNIREQITQFEATRSAKAARMTEIMSKAAGDGVTLDAAETEEYDGLADELKSIDAHLVRLNDLEKANVAAAKAVEGVTDTKSGSQVRSGVAVVKGSNVPKGTAFTRYAIALGRANGNRMEALEIAKGWKDSTPEVEAVLRAAVAAGTTTDPAWALPLVEYQNMVSEFAELLRPATIIGRIEGLRKVPFNIKIPRQLTGSTVNWVGQGKAKPVGALSFDQITLGMTKAAGIVVITDELLRASNPAAEALVRQDLIDQMAAFLDKDFVDPAKAAVADVSPASITHGVTPVAASGTDADALRADLQKLYAKFVAANMSINGAVWLMQETSALAISGLRNPLGQKEFPEINAQGGIFEGLPVVASQNIPANAGSGSPLTGAGSRIILAKASEILLADDGQTLLDVSREASLQMDSAPADGAQELVSLWQNNLVGIRAERFINWGKRRPGAVQYIDSANYGAA
jgi:HK97 family phage major capsid protein/HK97 family phage prohead protease